MKHHLVLKLFQQLTDDQNLPDWTAFINDKTVIRENLIPDVDRLMRELSIKFWVTKEYKPAAGDWNKDEIQHGLNRTYRMILQDDYNLPGNLLSRIKLIPAVEDARQLEVGEVRLPPREVSTAASVPTQHPGDLIYLPFAKAMTRGNADIKVAVLDTGANLDHQELQGKIVKRADFVDLEGLNTSDFVGDIKGYDDVPEDEVGHGTHVSGIIAGRGIQMDEGVAPECGLMAVRVLATMKSGNRLVGAGIVDNINAGIKWAVDNGADVINMSLGIRHTGGGLPHEDVVRYAISKNVVVVAASGNDGTNERYYPGALPGVFAVGAVDGDGAVTNFTSYGANITVVAPGLNIYSSFAHNSYAVASGTSQASPFVSGSIALAKSYALEQGQKLNNNEIHYLLKNTSDKVNSRLRDEHAGYGLLNLADAFKLLTHLLN